MFRRLAGLLVAAAVLTAPGLAVAQTPTAVAPIVIAHRGASGYRPEHTEAAYRLAVAQGADYIEADLVMTRDGVLVSRHENEIGRTTDVAAHPEFADRRAARIIDGEPFDGWYVEDFTLAELKTLGARERNPQQRTRSAAHDGEQPVLTLAEIIAIAREEGERRGRPVGLYIELKNPGYHASIGLPMEQALVDALQAADLNTREAPVIIQSFWPQALVALRPLAPVRLMFLINSVAPPAEILRANGIRSWSDVYSAEGLKRIATFADIVGPETGLIFPRDAGGRSLPATSFVADAHAAGLPVHVWSVNAENPHLPLELRRGDPSESGYEGRLGDAATLVRALAAAGVDGLFTDQPDIAVTALGR